MHGYFWTASHWVYIGCRVARFPQQFQFLLKTSPMRFRGGSPSKNCTAGAKYHVIGVTSTHGHEKQPVSTVKVAQFGLGKTDWLYTRYCSVLWDWMIAFIYVMVSDTTTVAAPSKSALYKGIGGEFGECRISYLLQRDQISEILMKICSKVTFKPSNFLLANSHDQLYP